MSFVHSQIQTGGSQTVMASICNIKHTMSNISIESVYYDEQFDCYSRSCNLLLLFTWLADLSAAVRADFDL